MDPDRWPVATAAQGRPGLHGRKSARPPVPPSELVSGCRSPNCIASQPPSSRSLRFRARVRYNRLGGWQSKGCFVQRIDIDQTTQAHFARIHRAALVLCGNPWDADDLAQETFLILARQGEQLSGPQQRSTPGSMASC